MPPSWRVVSMDIVTHNGDLVGPLRAAVRRKSQPTLRVVRAAWLTVDVTSSRGGTAPPVRHTNLRARVAAATFVEFTPTGIGIGVRTERVDPVYGRSLTWYLNASGRRPWRHPTFGRRTPNGWQEQLGQSVFFATIRARTPQFLAGIERAMEQVARDF